MGQAAPAATVIVPAMAAEAAFHSVSILSNSNKSSSGNNMTRVAPSSYGSLVHQHQWWQQWRLTCEQEIKISIYHLCLHCSCQIGMQQLLLLMPPLCAAMAFICASFATNYPTANNRDQSNDYKLGGNCVAELVVPTRTMSHRCCCS